MSDLGPESRALLDAARSADDPASGDRDRVRAKVAAAIAAGAGASGAGEGAASAGTAGGSVAAGGLAAKLALAILTIGALATGAYVAFRGDDSPPPPEVAAADPEPAPAPAPAADPAPVPAADPAPVPDPVPAPAADPEPAKKKPIKKPAERPPSADSLKEERAILARASAALRDGDTAGALAAVAEHAKKFPKGLLVEERSATKVLGLCAAGKVAQGEKARDTFLDRWPRSVHAARVQAACR